MNPRPLLATTAISTRPKLGLPTDVTCTNDIDWIAIERTVTGDTPRPNLTRAEQQTATLLLVRAGFSEKEAALLVGVQPRQISRWKYDHGLSGAKTCTVDDCNDPVKGRGLCHRHYRRDQRARQAAEKQPRSGRAPARCGTRPGYKRHLRETTPICGPCADANRAYQNTRNQTLKEAA